MTRIFFLIASTNGLIAVALGAIGSHLIKNSISPVFFQYYEMANRYHFYHVFAIFIVIFLIEKFPHKIFKFSLLLFMMGTFLFSGGMYIMSARQDLSYAAIVPYGGFSFILGWLFLIIGTYKYYKI